MKRKQMWILVGALLVALVLAFALQDLVRLAFVIPIAYLWWAMGVLFGGVSQVVLWGIFVFLVAVMLFNSLTARTPRTRLVREKARQRQGNVETLATAIDKTSQGIYVKWQVANRLGRLARDLLVQRGDRLNARVTGPLNGRGWQPSESVRAYLETGLNGSFADYPNPRWWFEPPQPTPLDLDVSEAVTFLETQMKPGDTSRR